MFLEQNNKFFVYIFFYVIRNVLLRIFSKSGEWERSLDLSGRQKLEKGKTKSTLQSSYILLNGFDTDFLK